MTERLFNGKPFKRTNRLTRDVPMTPLEKLGDALERCIVGCQGRRNAERAQAVLDVIKEQGWTLTPPGWQPIETAPKDGTSILWCTDRGEYMHKRYLFEVIRWPIYKECFSEGYWMSLPEPPKEDK